LQSAQWQARLNALQPTLAQVHGNAWYLIRFEVVYEARQSPKPAAFSNSYTVKGVKILGIGLTYYPIEGSGDLDYPDKPDWARSVWGGGYYWDATRKCAISSPAKSDVVAK
jgi:hypothetical protein